ncbi:hypothetical protein [Streptomyces yaizuensis]|uniref:Uncharacterized protein n=1 Tax=Streptomyces yaizuensis TaxID=2989713 RepID=A0AA86M9F1_9ACTN|nr:hypothetical protein [Streptomyces sp. YSPA8]BDT39565.1 hypothetical protein SYYSPA8_37235 [Streptomyces sp. YSPA8]
MINPRKKRWYIQLHQLGGVVLSGGWLYHRDGSTLTELGRRNPRFLRRPGIGDDPFAKVAQLRLVHDGRELICELDETDFESLLTDLIAIREWMNDRSRDKGAR